MKYTTGEEVRTWDRIRPWAGCWGVVVATLDPAEFTSRFPREAWSYLRRGILIDSTQAGLIHYAKPDAELALLFRGSSLTPEEWARLRREQLNRPNSGWQSGIGPSVQIGFVNPFGQICTGHRARRVIPPLPLPYRLECGHCGHEYGANESDVQGRRCPACQGGETGLEY